VLCAYTILNVVPMTTKVTECSTNKHHSLTAGPGERGAACCATVHQVDHQERQRERERKEFIKKDTPKSTAQMLAPRSDKLKP
jgi:hypothetical protein